MIHVYKFNGYSIRGVLVVKAFDSYSMINLYNENINTVITSDNVFANNKPDLNEFILVSYILDSNKIPLEVFGHNPELESFLLVKSTLESLIEGDNAYLEQDGRITEAIRENTIQGVKLTRKNVHMNKLRYQFIGQEKREEFNLVQKLSKLATVEDMKKKYDCSWVFNEDGSLKKKYKPITNTADLDWLLIELEKLPDKYEIGFDVETTGTNFFYMLDEPEKKDRILGFSMSWEDDQAVYIPLESKVFSCLNVNTVMDAVYKHLQRLALIAHNGIFEWKVMYDMGRTITITHDTLGIDFNLWTDRIPGWGTLKNLTRVWFGDETWEFEQLFGGGKNLDPEMLVYLPLDLITIYGCADSDYARKLKNVSFPYLNKSQIFPYRLDMAIIEILGKAEYYGYAKDMTNLKLNAEYYTKDLLRLESIMDAYVKEYGFKVYLEDKVEALVDKAGQYWDNTNGIVESRDEFIKIQVGRLLENADQMQKDFETSVNKVLDGKPYSGTKLSTVIFKILKYPVVAYVKKSKGQKKKEALAKEEALREGKKYVAPPKKPATDDRAISRWLSYKTKEPSKFFKEDLYSSDERKKSPWIKAERINQLRYPFALMLSEYNRLSKMLSTFLSGENATGSQYQYNEIQEFRTKTARIISTAQTISKDAKDMVVPYPNTYGINADYSQFEIRYMNGEANKLWHEEILPKINLENLSVYHRTAIDDYIKVLNNPETDVHRETASNMYRINADSVTGDQRHDAKGISFGTAYDMQKHSLSEGDLVKYADQFAENYEELSEEIEFDNGLGLDKWNFNNYALREYFKNTKAKLKSNVGKEGDLLPPYFGKNKMGYVENRFGRRRYFNLTDASKWDMISIDKEGGNTPVQSGTREMFFINKLNLYNDLKKEGLIVNPTDGSRPVMDKFVMTVFVHDEFYAFSDLNVHPYLYIKLIFKNCFVKIPYHPNYYMGINFVNNWKEGKDGVNELPVALVHDIAGLSKEEYPRFEDGYFYVYEEDGTEHKFWVVDYFTQLIKNWEHHRVIAEILKVLGKEEHEVESISEEQFQELGEKITSYAVTPLIEEYGSMYCESKNAGDRLKAIWDNRTHNYLFDEIECTRMDCSFEQDADLFSDLLLDESEEGNLDRDKTKEELGKELISKVLYSSTEIEFMEEIAEREEYKNKHVSLTGEENGNIIIRIDGKLIMNIREINPKYYNSLYADIKSKFYDANGSLVDVITNLGVKRLPFRVFNLDRAELERIWNKYKELSEM